MRSISALMRCILLAISSGLRQRAQNFSLADMPRAVQMAHDAGAKVYVTLNAYLAR